MNEVGPTGHAAAETPEGRASRMKRERAMLAEAEAELAAGKGVSGEALERWLEAFVGEGDLPEVTRP